MEARAAQRLHTAPMPSDVGGEGICNDRNSGQRSHSGSRSTEIQVDYEPSTSAPEKPAEEGIKEVDVLPPAEEASKMACLSPLTTASRCAWGLKRKIPLKVPAFIIVQSHKSLNSRDLVIKTVTTQPDSPSLICTVMPIHESHLPSSRKEWILMC